MRKLDNLVPLKIQILQYPLFLIYLSFKKKNIEDKLGVEKIIKIIFSVKKSNTLDIHLLMI